MATPGAAPTYPFDARPLVEPVDRDDVRAFGRALRARRGGAGVGVTVGIAAVVIAVGATLLSIFVGVFVSVIAAVVTLGDGSATFTLVGSVLPLLVMITVVSVMAIAVVKFLRGGADRAYRLDRFARANGMRYEPGFANPALPGMIFGLGSARRSIDLIRGDVPRFVEFANYTYTTGSGKNRTTHRWGYVAVKLDVPLPHIVLDAQGNNGLFGSNLPAAFDQDQRLSLEGDFDRHFALYCPQGYEQDALYLFTPDIMARFIDNAAALDVEIVDDWLFLYARRDFSTLDPATWAWLFSVVAAILDKLAQWARWRDDRLAAPAPSAAPVASAPGVAAASVPFSAPPESLRPPPGVAAGGLRLRRRVPWVTFVVAGIVLLFWLLGQWGVFGALLEGLFGP
jgi:hypothetical protein